MVTLGALWLPILLSAVLVFVASALVHMVLTYHRADYRQLPDEAKVLDALRGARVAPGAYIFPYAASPKEMGSPEMRAKYERGPLGILNVRPAGPPAMAKNLVQWFVFCLLVGLFVAYLASRSLAAGADYLDVFQITGTVAFLAYSFGALIDAIWKWQAWSTTLKDVIDGLIYALLTAGVFGWRWPAA